MRYLPFIAALFVFSCLPAWSQDNGPTRATLHDGVRLIAKNEPSSNLVAITVFIEAGSAQENVPDAGIGSMVADCLLTGTTNQNPDTISTAIGNVGGNVKAIWEPDVTQIRALILPSQFADTAYLLSDVLKNADFPESSVESAREDLLSRIQERTDDVFDSTNDRLRGALYSGSAYALPQIGTVQTIKRLTRTELLEYFDRYYRPDNILISVVGNIDEKTVQSTFDGDLADFNRPPTHRTEQIADIEPVADTTPLVIKSYRPDVTGDLMMIGYLAPGFGTKDYPAMVIANALLGGMKTSLMFKNLRIKKKYGYELASDYTTQANVSDVTAYILYSPDANSDSSQPAVDQTPEIKQALLDQFKLLYSAPPSDDDLARAKKFVIGSYLLSHERIEDRSYYLGYTELEAKDLGGYLLDTNYSDAINAVTGADVVRVAKKYFNAQPVISLLLPGDPSAGVKSY